MHPRNKHVFEALRTDAEAAGYFTRTVVAMATDFGAPQARQRVFLLGSREAQPEAPAATHFKAPTDGQLPWVTSGDALRRFEGEEYSEGNEEVTGTWASHLKDVPPGMNYKFHTSWAGHQNPTFETETRYWNFLLKLDPERPSWTIPASPGPWTGPFHWSGRRLRISELAALQTFPDGYHFSGPRREQVRQIGNAVPSVMAEQMVLAAMNSLSAKRSVA
ncbi:hypothetical protein GCM10009655_24650 [Rhodoglobus aureus]|uniref:DNA (cytosine-5-)-methyltransferase n=2 Tax=Rhodoglobus aureus TaxID=191497 RepID=A0ABP4GH40_9MICO